MFLFVHVWQLKGPTTGEHIDTLLSFPLSMNTQSSHNALRLRYQIAPQMRLKSWVGGDGAADGGCDC